MSLRSLVCRTYALLIALLCLACGDERVIPRSEVVVSIDSDLSPGAELSRVEVRLLELGGSMELEHSEFVLSGDEGVELPFTFTITQGKQDRFRLEVTGYAPKATSGEEKTVEYEVIGQFRHQKRLALHVLLARGCLDVECTGDRTCYPLERDGTAAGSCGPIPEETRLPLHPAAAPIWPDAAVGEDAGTADGGTPDGGRGCADGSCSLDCSTTDGASCKADPGAACSDGSTCKSGFCVDGVCCRSACEGDCRACNLRGSEGTCSELDYSRDTDNCGSCGNVCSDQNIPEPMCVAGTCGGECAPGYDSCIAGNDGCETYVEDNPEHCGGCGNGCLRPYCLEGKCGEAWGSGGMSEVRTCVADRFYAYPVLLTEPGTLVAIGLLTKAGEIAPAPRIRLALFRDDEATPGETIRQTDELEVVDTRIEGELLFGTEGEVAAVALEPGTYWVGFNGDVAYDVYFEEREVEAIQTSSVPYDEFQQYAEITEATEFFFGPNASAYLVVVPGA